MLEGEGSPVVLGEGVWFEGCSFDALKAKCGCGVQYRSVPYPDGCTMSPSSEKKTANAIVVKGDLFSLFVTLHCFPKE